MRIRPRALTVVVLILGALVTATLTVAARVEYHHNEQRLTSLQTQLTASALGIAQDNFELILGKALGSAAISPSPVAAFRAAITSSLAPKGPFASVGLRLYENGTLTTLVHLGAAPVISLNGSTAQSLYDEAARSSTLVTSRVVGNGQQRLSYFLSTKTTRGILIAAASESVPNKPVKLQPNSPDADLYFALYFGKSTSTSALVETNSPRIPLGGPTSMATAPFGSNVLTLVASPRAALAGAWSADTPWVILASGLLFTVAIAALTDRLIRRRRRAEALYGEQRAISETLQRSLLPKKFPEVEGLEFGALYRPAETGLEVGGDWYSAIAVEDDDRVAFVVGDVSGHGVRAATVMASLRFTVRAFASVGYSPARILQLTSREIDLSADGHFATVLVGVIDPKTGTTTLATAGHPPPLLIGDHGAHFVDVPVGRPLGIGRPLYEEVTVTLDPGATLFAYTDGLVERRSAILDEGLERLRTASESPTRSVNDLIDHVVRQLLTEVVEDDVAIFAVRRNS